jgi:hypothetical protein
MGRTRDRLRIGFLPSGTQDGGGGGTSTIELAVGGGGVFWGTTGSRRKRRAEERRRAREEGSRVRGALRDAAELGKKGHALGGPYGMRQSRERRVAR